MVHNKHFCTAQVLPLQGELEGVSHVSPSQIYKMYIHKHILVGSNIDYIWSKKNKVPIVDHDNIVIHYTAGANAISSANYLANDNTKASAHLIIGRDGKIYQLVNFDTQAWHAGKSQMLGKTGQNAFTVGIELDYSGLLHENNNRYYSWFGKRIPESEVIKLVNPQTGFHAWWHTYSEIQLNTLKEICLVHDKTVK